MDCRDGISLLARNQVARLASVQVASQESVAWPSSHAACNRGRESSPGWRVVVVVEWHRLQDPSSETDGGLI